MARPDHREAGRHRGRGLRRDIADRVNVVLIIDGSFFQHAALPPSEVLDAVRAGVRVYGASSMGALRAVELEPYGVIGVGRIVELLLLPASGLELAEVRSGGAPDRATGAWRADAPLGEAMTFVACLRRA